MSAFWLGVIPLAGGFSVFLLRWIWSSYAVFRDCAQSGQQKVKAAEKEAQELRQSLLELRSAQATEDRQQVFLIAANFCAAFRKYGQPECPNWKMKMLLEAGLLSLAEIPDSSQLFKTRVAELGASNPFSGVNALGEEMEWDTDRMWTFLPWAVQQQIFTGDKAEDAQIRYLEAIMPFLAEGNAPDFPLVAKPSVSVFNRRETA